MRRTLARSIFALALLLTVLVPGGRAVAATVVTDTFNRPDAAGLGTATSGEVWEATIGQWRTVGNQATHDTGYALTLIEAGGAEGTASAELPVAGSEQWLIVRAVDTQNYWRCGKQVNLTDYSLQLISGNDLGTIANPTYGAILSPSDGDVISVEVSATGLVCSVNGTMVMSAADTTFASASKVGVAGFDVSGLPVATRIDNFSFTPPDSEGVDFEFDIPPVLNFSIAAQATSCNGMTPSAGSLSSASVMSFGMLSPLSNRVVAQDLVATTNAASGVTVSVRALAPLRNVRNKVITDVAGTNEAPGPFPAPGVSAFGYTTSDPDLGTGTAARFTSSANRWAAVSTQPKPVLYAATAAESFSQNVCVAYQVGMGPDDEAGLYSTSLVYTAVSQF